MNNWELVDIELSDKSINKVWVCRDGKDSFIDLSATWTNISLDGQDLQKLLNVLAKPSETL